MDNIIIGAGISGLALALFLSRKNQTVAIYDKRNILDQNVDGRSINFTISGRGLHVLEQLDLKNIIMQESAILAGRIVHLANQKIKRYQYGTISSNRLLSIRRSKLIDILLNEVYKQPNITFYPSYELIDIDTTQSTCVFLDHIHQKNISAESHCIIGADGVFSDVRRLMLKKQITSYQQTVFDWGYKEFRFDAPDAQKLKLNTHYMHMWPKKRCLLVAIPNKDNTFSVIFTAPLRDHKGDMQHFDHLVKQEYPELTQVASSLGKNMGDQAYNYMISIKLAKWHLQDKVVLLGDACHATYPFYGQGMNSALEDACVLSHYLCQPNYSRLQALTTYEKIKKADADALHNLSEAHLYHMTKAMASPYWQASDIIDFYLAKFSKKWFYEYELVAHSTIQYAHILEKVKKQNQKKIRYGLYILSFVLGLILTVIQV